MKATTTPPTTRLSRIRENRDRKLSRLVNAHHQPGPLTASSAGRCVSQPPS